MHRIKEGLSLGELFAELTREIGQLIRQEMALATAELGHKAGRVGQELGFLVAGGAVAYAGFLAILAGVIVGLALFIPLWLSALLVGAVVAGIGYLLVQKGLTALKHVDLAPRRTIATLKEDAAWAKEQTT